LRPRHHGSHSHPLQRPDPRRSRSRPGSVPNRLAQPRVPLVDYQTQRTRRDEIVAQRLVPAPSDDLRTRPSSARGSAKGSEREPRRRFGRRTVSVSGGCSSVEVDSDREHLAVGGWGEGAQQSRRVGSRAGRGPGDAGARGRRPRAWNRRCLTASACVVRRGAGPGAPSPGRAGWF
jgi:hypothetical protein